MTISLSWLSGGEENLIGAQVYRATESEGFYSQIATVIIASSGSSYTDEDGVLGDWYSIKEYNSLGDFSSMSDPVEAIAKPVCRVYGNLADFSSNSDSNYTILITTQPRRLYYNDTNEIVPDAVQCKTDSAGWFQIELIPNVLLEPVDSLYVFSITGVSSKYEFQTRIPNQSECNFATLIEAK